jgi:hypothetical protein
MPVTVTCPECDDSYQVSDQAAEQMVRCRRCQCPIEPKKYKEGIQARRGDLSRRRDEEDEPEHRRVPLSHPVPRSPFPWTALLLVVIGILIFLLAFSVGFNVWFLTLDDHRRRF